MARFMKFISRVLLIAYIAVILALIVPPLIGYTTATVLDTTQGNQDVGTVDYAERIPLDQLTIGDKILVTGSDSVNVYTVQDVDAATSTVTVADTDNQQIPVRSYVYKMIVAIPFIGYVIIALQSMEGIIVLAMIAVLLILICILTGIWSKKVKEKKRARKEQKKAEKAEKAAKAANTDEQPEQKEEEQQSSDTNRVLNARAEAYFAARKAEQNKVVFQEEYEDFPPKPAPVVAKAEQAVPKTAPAVTDYFDDDEEDDEADSWLHDDVDDEDLFAGLNNSAATESLMATARLFAINRAAQVKEKMATSDLPADLDKTRVVAPETLAAAKAQKAAASIKMAGESAVPATKGAPVSGGAEKQVSKTPIREISVDKVINMKELREMQEDTEQIVLKINIKIVPE